MNLESVMLPLSKLKRLPRNPKEHDIGAIHKSIDAFGFIDRIVINRTTEHILSGHGRIDALQQKKAGGKKAPEGVTVNGKDWLIPADYVELPADKEEAAAIALNRMVELGGWNDVSLASILSDLAAIGQLEATGYTGEDLDEILRKLNGKEYDESIADGVKVCVCKQCGNEHSSKEK
jgi:hypothetical protein